jgi:hypothetical protein
MPSLTIGAEVPTDTDLATEELLDGLSALTDDGEKRTLIRRFLNCAHDEGRRQGLASRNDTMSQSIGHAIDQARAILDTIESKVRRA